MAPAREARPGTTLLSVQVEFPAFKLLSHAHFHVRINDYEELHEGVVAMLQDLAESFEERLVGIELEDSKYGLERMKTSACVALEELRKEVRMVDEWKMRAERAAQHMNKMRDAYYRELFHLREQVYQKRKAEENDDTFRPIYALHFDPSDYTLEDEVAKLVHEKVQLLQQEFQTKLDDIESRHAAKVKTLKNSLATSNMFLSDKEELLKKVVTKQATLQHFRRFLSRRFGSLKEAKQHLGASRDLEEGLSITELRSLAEELGYACADQDIRGLFKELANNQPTVTLAAILGLAAAPRQRTRRASISGPCQGNLEPQVAAHESDEAQSGEDPDICVEGADVKRSVAAAAVLTELSLDSGTTAAWADQRGSLDCFLRHRPPGSYKDQGTEPLPKRLRSRAVQSQIDGRMLDKAIDFYDNVAESNWNALMYDLDEAPASEGIAPVLLEAFEQKGRLCELPSAEHLRLCSTRSTHTLSATDLRAVEGLVGRVPEGDGSGGGGAGSSGSGNPGDGSHSRRLRRRVTHPPQRDRVLQARLDALAAELTSLPARDLGERFSAELQELAPGIERICCGSLREQLGGSASSRAPSPSTLPVHPCGAQPCRRDGVSYCHRGSSPLENHQVPTTLNVLEERRAQTSTAEFGVQCCLAMARRVAPPGEDEPHERQMEQVEHVVGVAHELLDTLPALKLRAEKLAAQATPGSRIEQLLHQLQRLDAVLGGHPVSPSENVGMPGAVCAQTPSVPPTPVRPTSSVEGGCFGSTAMLDASFPRQVSASAGDATRKDARRHTAACLRGLQKLHQQGDSQYYFELVRAAPMTRRESSLSRHRRREESLCEVEQSLPEDGKGEGDEEEAEEEEDEDVQSKGCRKRNRKSLTARKPMLVDTPGRIVDRARRRALLAQTEAQQAPQDVAGEGQERGASCTTVASQLAVGVAGAAERQREGVKALPKVQADLEVAGDRLAAKHPEPTSDGKAGQVDDDRGSVVHRRGPLPPIDDHYLDIDIEEITAGDDAFAPKDHLPRAPASTKTLAGAEEVLELPSPSERPDGQSQDPFRPTSPSSGGLGRRSLAKPLPTPCSSPTPSTSEHLQITTEDLTTMSTSAEPTPRTSVSFGGSVCIQEVMVGADQLLRKGLKGHSTHTTCSARTPVAEQQAPELPSLAAERPGSRSRNCSERASSGTLSPAGDPRRRCAPASAKLPAEGTTRSSGAGIATPRSSRTLQAFDFEDLPSAPARPDQSPPGRRQARVRTQRRSVEAAPHEEVQSAQNGSTRNSVASQASIEDGQSQPPSQSPTGDRSSSPQLRSGSRRTSRVTPLSRTAALLARADALRAAGRDSQVR